MHDLSLLKQIPLDRFNSKEIFNFKNGVLDLKTGEFGIHKASYLSTIRFPYKYDPTAKHPHWDYFLETSLDGNKDYIKVLQEFFGYCLGRDNRFHKALVLIGDGRNGKGTTFRIIEKLVGIQNRSVLKLGEMNKQENVSVLVNKLVNIDADTDASARGFESDFRRISAGDSITARKLYENVFSFVPFCKLIIGANELPRIADKTHGFYDRLIIIPYEVSFVGREDRNLDDKLESELSGIFNWALEGRKRLYEQGHFSVTKTMYEFIHDIRLENNPVALYVNENIVEYKGASTLKSQVYEHYKDFCDDNNNRPLAKNKFGKEFFRLLKKVTTKDARVPNADTRAHVWTNIYIKGVNDPVQAGEPIEWEEPQKTFA